MSARLITFCMISLLISGCTGALRNQQLEKVAKDWALVIRASQVIPVYPLTEDLQPGDVLLVSTPIEDQVRRYKEKGFLALDQHLVRLYSTDFTKFYNSRYGIRDEIVPPAMWQTLDRQGKHQWGLAPRAAFPTYSFSASSGSGLNLAVPVQGVPLAIGLMHAGKASGTLTIADSFTYGLDHVHLLSLVQTWANANRRILRQYASQNNQQQFLRVVSRVYSTGQITATVNNDDAVSGEGRGGANKPVDLPGLAPGESEKNYSEALAALNNLVSDELPGGKVKFAAATNRSITFSETFPRPLVIGYVGFDLPILEGGRLGPPLSTLAQLNAEQSIPAQSVSASTYRLATYAHLYKTLQDTKGSEAEHIRRDLDALAQKLPTSFPFSLYEFSAPGVLQKDTEIVAGKLVTRKSFQDVVDYVSLARKTSTTLESYLAGSPENNPNVQIDLLEQERLAAAKAGDEFSQSLSSEPAVIRAVDFVLFDQP